MKRNVFIVTVNGFDYRVEASTVNEAIRALRIAGEQGVVNDVRKEVACAANAAASPTVSSLA